MSTAVTVCNFTLDFVGFSELIFDILSLEASITVS